MSSSVASTSSSNPLAESGTLAAIVQQAARTTYRRRARVRCGACEACLREDCGKCGKCIRKKKFGGDGTCKEACVLRRCMNMKERPVPTITTSGPSSSEAAATASYLKKASTRISKEVLQQQQQELDAVADGTAALVSSSLVTATTPASNPSTPRSPYPSEDDLLDQYIIREEAKMSTTMEACETPRGGRKTSVLVEATVTAATDSSPQHEPEAAKPRNSNTKRKRGSPTHDLLSKSKKRRGRPSKTGGALNNNGNTIDSTGLLLYGKPAPEHSRECCAGCLGKRTEELAADPIIFCDGCDREFHLDCCMPPLETVPEGTHFCLDCNVKGTTACLEEYFDRHHEERADEEYTSSHNFVLQTLQDRLVDTNDEEEDDDVIKAPTRRIPQSELSRASKLHHDATAFSSRFIQLKNISPRAMKETKLHNVSNKNQLVEDIKPTFFLGKCIRLYCPIDNQYHSGRIVDWRIAGHSTVFWESEVSNIEYLVRFPAGKDYRKVPYQQWIVLEEHALAVASTLIWGMNVTRRGVMGWNPGSTWLRTSLELIPIQAYLEHEQHQIYFYNDSADTPSDNDGGSDEVRAEHKSWALASFYGEDQHEFLDLKDEAVDYFSIAFGEARFQRTILSSTVATVSKSSGDVDPRIEVSMGLAHVEWEEQQRVKAWQAMKLVNPRHPKALTLGDESTLEPCLDRERHVSLCPSVQIDFDRTYLLTTMIEKGKLTKDVAASLVCELIAPSPQVMKQLQQQS